MILKRRRVPGLIYSYRYTLYSILILFATVIYFLFRWNLLCINGQAWRHVKKMCLLYEDGHASGSLCAPICTAKEIHSITCHSFQASKEAVFSGELNNNRLVIKSTSTDVKPLHWYDNGHIRYPNEREFSTTLKAVVKNKLNLTLDREDLERLSSLNVDHEEKNIIKRQIEMDNLWVLVQDHEYLTSIIYSDKDVFPQLIGTCGSYFAVEYMSPIPDISTLLTIGDDREDWGKRLKYAVQILDLLDELETGFREPFYLCDIKIEHFGLVKGEHKMKFIDLDRVYPKSVINKIITDTEHCENDEDCDFYDCRARCNKQTKKCGNHVANNNLQIVCEKIFLGWRMSNTVIVPGLLMTQHTPSELATILRVCANPESEDGVARAIPNQEFKTRLYNVLFEVEQSVNSYFFL